MSNLPARVLVLGATGHVGQAVVRRALSRGRFVTAATRQTDPVALRGLGAHVVRIEDEFDNLAGIAAGHDVMVDAAAPHPLDPALPGGLEWRQTVRASVRRTERVLEAARLHGMQLVFVSSFTTLPRDESPLRAWEAAWRRSVYPYFETKTAMERAVIEASQRGLPAVVVNPSACLGPWEFRAAESSFVGLVLERRLPVVMDLTINVIDVRDVALAVELALEKERFGRPIPLAGHNLSVAALAERIAALGGAPAPATIDHRAASAAAFWTQAAFGVFGRPTPDLWRAVPLLADGFPMQPSLEQLSIELPLRPLDDTLRDAVAFHRDAVAFDKMRTQAGGARHG